LIVAGMPRCFFFFAIDGSPPGAASMPEHPGAARISNLNFSFRLSIKFYRLSSAPVERRDEPINQRLAKTARNFAASPKFSDGTGRCPA
jgi:hypothetical protein